MKAIALYGKKDARIIEKPVPQAEENQLVVKIDYVGICGTDVEFFQSGAVPPFVHLPMVLGHENVGTVVEVGKGVTDFKVGDTDSLWPSLPLRRGLPLLPSGQDQHLHQRLPPHGRHRRP